jgi:hypothetical protein
MLDSSNLIHLGAFAVYLGILMPIASNVRVKPMRNLSSLIQLAVLLLCIDLLVGFFLVGRHFDNHQSASWIAKSLYGVPVLFGISIWWLRRSHDRAKQRAAKRPD